MDNNQQHIEEIIREKFEQFAPVPPPNVWDGIEKGLVPVKLSFLGSIVNGVDENTLPFSQAAKITSNVHQAISGLWGFIGIDLILHKDELFVIDINPRLTTSYIGLRQSLNHNPAQLLFTMMEQGLSAFPAPLLRHAIEVNV